MPIGRIILLFSLLIGVRADAAEDHVRATILADLSAVQASKTFSVGILLKIDPGWHIYWINPGDSGMATKIKLDLPAGFVAGPVQYPIPTRIDLPGEIVNYGYENEVMLMVPITPSAKLAREVQLNAHISWLVCKDVCLPGKATVKLQLPTSNDSATANTDLFHRWTQQLPMLVDSDQIENISSAVSIEKGIQIVVHWKRLPADIQWFPAPIDGFDLNEPSTVTTGDQTLLSAQLSSPSGAKLRQTIDSVLTYKRSDGTRVGVDIPIHSPPP